MDLRYIEMRLKLWNVQQTLRQMSQRLSPVIKSSDIACGRNSNILVQGIPEPYMKVRRVKVQQGAT